LDKQKKNKRNVIILLASLWLISTLPLPWLFTSPDVTQDQIIGLMPIIGIISIPFIALGIAWTLKPELTT
jgi:hypothetical protein|tara:strand:- start:118 stop:327 length:210 start_codon:yes stop_codon:yes gene_type:complete